jgi:hypothetical protein
VQPLRFTIRAYPQGREPERFAPPAFYDGALRQARLEGSMLDLIFVAAIVAFFAVARVYVHACERI